MPWPLYIALKSLFPTGRRGSFFAWISVLGVMLGVMVLLIVQSVMNGFGYQIKRTLLETNGDIRIESGQPIGHASKILELAKHTPGIAGASPYAQGIVMMQYGNHPAFPCIRGIDLEQERTVVPLDTYLVAGRLDLLDDESVLVSSQLAAALDISLGATVEIYTPLMLEKLNYDTVVLPRELEVVGIYQTGWNQVDSKTILTTLRVMQELYGLEDYIHGIAIRLDPTANEDKIARALNTKLPEPLRAFTAVDTNRDLLFILKLEKTILFFIILFVILVSAFSIASSLMTTVLRKTREIGLLGAMGAQPKQIALSFCMQGLVVGVVGTALGVVGALVALHYRNSIVHTFARLTHSEDAFIRFYQFSNIPVYYETMDFIIIIPLAILISTLAACLPAWHASRLKPAQALRYE